MEKRILTRDELLTLSNRDDTKEILKKTYEVLEKYKHFKYISKNTKKDLENIGFRYVTKYVTCKYELDYNIKSKEIDLLYDNSGIASLRVGLGRQKRYNPEWYEININL